MKKKHLILIAVASYFLFLIATIPAKLVTDSINNNTPITIHGVSGTLWNGSAYNISIDANNSLRETNWSLSPWGLLIGQLSSDVNSHYLNNEIKAEVGASFFGRFFINNLSTNIAAKDLAKLAEIPLAQLDGSIEIDIESAEWTQGELPLAIGFITWNNASVTVSETAKLGDVKIRLSETDQNTINAEIKNNDKGDLKVSGTAQLVPEADYVANIILAPTKTATSSITQSLSLFAKKQNNGNYLINNSGSLRDIGMM